MPKRKLSAVADAAEPARSMPPPPVPNGVRRRSSQRGVSTASSLDPATNSDVLDAPNALRASPDSDVDEKKTPGKIKNEDSDSPLSDVPASPVQTPSKAKGSKVKKETPVKANGETPDSTPKPAAKAKPKQEDDVYDPEAEDGDDAADPEEIKQASTRPPAINSSRLPLPFTGRIGYACLCTYLRFANPPVFCSRTTRIASILEHRHPLADPSQPEHATKNRPDKEKPADISRGQKFVENLCIQNVRDMVKLIRWNDKYGIKFLRLSSEAFPFASHAEYGYKLAPFAADALAEVGKVAGELGHRLTTHPGQFTQLGSPRPNVITAAIKDLEYHEEMLSLLQLPEQLDRDAIMILHMGGVFGDKAATLDRFRANYKNLSAGIKKRLVLENDDVSWSVHELLPICEELNIPFVLDYHHHNIIFDSTQIREGTHDIQELYPRILQTWKRKGITPKMHYSEPTPAAITPKHRRKHNPRVATLPPVPDGCDLMIEAKDKEQAVFELMRNFKLPGYERINDIIPHVREDENRPVKPPPKKKSTPKKKKKAVEDEEDDDDDNASVATAPPSPPAVVPEEELNMGGPQGRVYWPPGMEEWLRPVKRVVKKKEPEEGATGKLTAAQRKIVVAQAKAELAAEMKEKKAGENKVPVEDMKGDGTVVVEKPKGVAKAAAEMNSGKKGKGKGGDVKTEKVDGDGVKKAKGKAAKGKKRELTPNSEEDAQEEEEAMQVDGAVDGGGKRRKSGRGAKAARKSYKEEEVDE